MVRSLGISAIWPVDKQGMLVRIDGRGDLIGQVEKLERPLINTSGKSVMIGYPVFDTVTPTIV